MLRMTVARSLRRCILDLLIQPNSTSCYFSSSSHVISSPFTSINPPKCSMNELIWSQAEKWPNATALKCSVTGESVTYRDLLIKSKQLAASLLKTGLNPKEIVTVMMPNSPAFALAVLGILEAGMRVTFINPVFTEGEILHLLKDSGSKAVITTNAHEASILKAASRIPKRRIQLICSKDFNADTTTNHAGTIKLDDLLQSDADISQIERRRGALDLNDLAALLYSSGTTGMPKGVCLSNRALTCSVSQAMHTDVISVPEASSDFQACVPALLPMFHSYGLLSLSLKALYAGAMIITIPKFHPASFLDVLKRNKNIVLHAVPHMIHFLHSHPDVTKSHLQNLDLTMVAGAAFSKLDCEMLLAKWNHTVLNTYGTTETSAIAQSSPNSSDYFCMKLMPNVSAKIVSDSGDPLSTGQEGEICIKGPQLMSNYYKNPEATAETIDEEGWFHTGDVGFFDENENLHLEGRIKELIKVKGYQVSPVELEEVIKNHPDVQDVGITAVDCPKAGERPVAFIVSKDGVRLNEKEIESYVSERVAPYKRLAQVIFIDQIPRSATGKILRRSLQEIISKK